MTENNLSIREFGMHQHFVGVSELPKTIMQECHSITGSLGPNLHKRTEISVGYICFLTKSFSLEEHFIPERKENYFSLVPPLPPQQFRAEF